MKSHLVGVVVVLSILGLVERSDAEGNTWGIDNPRNMIAEGGLEYSYTGIGYLVCFNFTFRLDEHSDGIYPAAELIEVEVPGELIPDGNQSSSFVISIPAGSFEEDPWQNGRFISWNPRGLSVSQRHGSFVWEFVRSGDKYSYPSDGALGVKLFWGGMRLRGEGDGISMRIKIRMSDNRAGALRRAPRFFELLYGAPILRIGNDEWDAMWFPSPPFSAGTC